MSENKQSMNRQIVSREEWLSARRELLKKEKELTRRGDELTRERANLPWVRIEKNYAFETDHGKKTLAELFDGRSQLIVYHFMFAPDWEEGCQSCSLAADSTLEGSYTHLAARDVTLIAVSRAPLAKIENYKRRMGWNFQWVSSLDSDFNRDFHVSFTPEEAAAGKMFYNFETYSFPNVEAPGLSVFYKNEAGEIFHTYSTYARGVEALLGVYPYLDFVPKGRDEEALSYPMAWVRRHDRYEQKYFAGTAENLDPETEKATHSCCGAEVAAA